MGDRIRVLHVDDDREYAEMAASMLERAAPRIEVTVETRATEALDRLEDDQFDCVISDYQMPEMDGISLLETVHERYPDLPFILLTAQGSEAVASDAIDAGVTHYQRKEAGEERYRMLANRVVNAVEHARAERRARDLARINSVARDVSHELMSAESRTEIEERVCAVIADSEPYQFAWIGTVEDGAIGPRTWAGKETDYLEGITLTTDPDDPTGRGPAGRAVRTGEIAVSQDVTTDPSFEPWRNAATRRGFASVAAVPLLHDGELYGVLGVYADRRETFDERERDLLADLGADIARAIHDLDLRAELRRYETIVQALGDPVYALDTDGRYTFVNDAFVEQTGYSREEVLGEHVSMVIPPEDIEKGRSVIRELLESDAERGTYETERITAAGERRLAENNLALLVDDDGTFRGTAGVQRDITDRKRRERALERQNERLDRLADLLSHELRNPINVASGYLELLEAEYEDDRLGRVVDAVDRMEEMVESLLVMTREGAYVEETDPVALEAVARACWSNVVTRGARLEVEGAPTIRADESRLRHVLENLFENSVEHGSTSPPLQAPEDAANHGGKDITVRIGPLDGGEGFYVEDDGDGLPEAERDRLFESGYSPAGGTGLGLAVVDEIAEAHGWTVTVADGEEGGARFEFRGVEVVE